MTLKQKREIVKRFKSGWRLNQLRRIILNGTATYYRERPSPLMRKIRADIYIEETLRDFINGKFTLKPKEPSE